MLSWDKRTLEFSALRTYASQFTDLRSVTDWLYAIGVVPNDVLTLPPPIVLTEVDPHAIRAGYLAASAMEWDKWGPSSPDQFLDAIECELAGSPKHGNVVSFLTALGKTAVEEEEVGA